MFKYYIKLSYTDSLLFSVKTTDIYRDMVSFKQHLDCSKYTDGHILSSMENYYVQGKFKVI